MKNKIILFITLLGSILCTIGLFHLLFNEHSTLFYVNVFVTCVVETIWIANIPIWSNKKLLTFKNAATSSILNLYGGILLLWTIIYSIVTTEESDFKILYIGILVISIIFILLLGATETGGNVMKQHEECLQKTVKTRKKLLISLDNYWLDIKDIFSAINNDRKEDMLRSIKMVLDRISAIPAGKLEQNEDVIDDINNKLNELKKLCEELTQNEITDSKESEIIRKTEQLKNFITTIKSSL